MILSYATLSSAVGLKSCNDYQRLYNMPSGYYYIDPDGEGSGGPFEVYCDMSRAPPLTILENEAACGYTYRQVSGKHHYYSQSLDVDYRVEVSDEQLDTLIKSSS